MGSRDPAEPMSPGEATQSGARPADRHGLLKHSREFLDFFWDIAKPEQETRLEATEKLLEYLRGRPKGSEMKYALKRLITGLGVGRETARPCYSLALAQLLQSFEDLPLCSILQQIQEKYDLHQVKKATLRPALFANLFGVLALFQSGRLVKDQEALMKSVKLLQALAQYQNHLQEQPRKALVDVLSEVSKATFQEILPEVLKADLNIILSSPEQLELFLLAQQKVPSKLKKLVGSVNLFSDENVPRLVNVLKMAASSVKKDRQLPAIALDLLRLALKEDKFPRFWKEVVEQGLLKIQFWPASYLCFRLLGAALPLLTKEQLQLVMQGDVIRHYGEHVCTAKLPKQFRFAPEMDDYVGTFLEGCQDDPERQLAVLVAFSSVTNQGLPVTPTFWRVVRFLSPLALQGYVAWLRAMFLQPDLDSLVDFSTNNQKKAQDSSLHVPERAVFRLRKWIIFRLVSIVDSLHLEMEEALTEQVARFCLFHSFFITKKPTSQIPETKEPFSFPLESQAREAVSSAFFSLLQTLSTQFKQAPDQTRGGQPWTYHLVQFADLLLNHSHNVTTVTPFTEQQRQAWDRMLQTLKELEAHSSEARAAAFQHLLLLVGIHLLKSPAESCDLLGDIQTCIRKSLGEKPHRSRAKAIDPQEPPWVEVLVEVLLALLAQPSHLMRQVARSVFGHICSHLTPRALQLILDVLNPETSEDEDDRVVVMDDSVERRLKGAEDKSEDGEDNRSSESEEESEGEESEEEERDGDVDQGFREQLMTVLQAGKALGGEDSEDEEELGDEAMMALDQSLASLFAEQKLRIQARRDEKNKLQKEKALRRDFQIRVLDLVEVLVTKQPENALVLELLEPLLSIIRRSLRSSSSKQEQDLLHKTARIFTHHLCRARRYCHDLGERAEALHAQVERLVQQAGRQPDSPTALYHFNASLYLLRVLKGNTAEGCVHETQEKQKAGTDPSLMPMGPQAASCLDLNLVTRVYSTALSSFLTKRNSPLTVPMFLSLFSRHPVLCKSLLPIPVQHITGPVRPRHQACLLLQKSLSMREVRSCFEEPEWKQLMGQVLAKVTENLRVLGEARTKAEHQQALSSLELLNALFRTCKHEKLTLDLTVLLGVLQGQQQSLQQGAHSTGSSRLHDLYWQAMKTLGVQRPKLEKDAKEVPSATQSPISKKRKKKGFLPETKKRKKRKSEDGTSAEDGTPAATGGSQPPSMGRKKRNRTKAKVPAQANVTPSTKSPAPGAPTLSPSTPAKFPKLQKKNQKPLQVNGAPGSPAEPAGQKQHQKALPKKGVLGKSPPSALARKKARLSLVIRSPSLLQSGAKKKKAQLRKAGKP
ncbi:myb-binding protein 1A isoform X1 [Hylobates moloch]|uniref:myb-binding protein 1A isoform X1 n=2 Tax=Hylobates moloch TaxID=81572 RepID=UPI0013630E12|nr:myb-binding protein 1A isoform X1 [Hylobates moloch]XP_031993804.1 myb-binding protein 1A isoform X1 [Hylobates moloch]